MSDWVLVVVGPISLLLGIGISELRQWRQEKEQYKFLTFEKRLAVHQEAFKLSGDLWHVFFDALTGQGMPIEGELRSEVAELREWWRGNCLWLDSASRKVLLDLAYSAEVYAESYDPDDAKKCLDLANKANKTITEGIGQRYLPEVRTKSTPNG